MPSIMGWAKIITIWVDSYNPFCNICIIIMLVILLQYNNMIISITKYTPIKQCLDCCVEINFIIIVKYNL